MNLPKNKKLSTNLKKADPEEFRVCFLIGISCYLLTILYIWLFGILKRTLAGLLILGSFVLIVAQKDSIYIEATLSPDRRTLKVTQDIVYHNKTQTPQNEVQLLNWIAAYKTRGSALYERKIEDRSKELHFAKPEDLGKLKTLSVNIDGLASENATNLTSENLYFELPITLKPGERTEIHLRYELQLPLAKFTGYGTSEQNVALKYFFLVPDSFELPDKGKRKFLDTGETANHSTFWTVNLDVPPNSYTKSNLPEVQPQSFKGYLENDPEFLISTNNYPTLNANVGGEKVAVDFGYNLKKEERQHLEFYLPLHLQYLREKTGLLPKKIYLSEKFKNKEDFFGNDDIEFWKFRFPLFTPAENIDLDYFSIISKNVIEQNFITNKEDDHWFKNGIKTYIELQYLKKNYADHKLLGQLTDASIIGIKPLKIFHASRLKLIERYGIAYQYMMTQNLDQKIDSDFKDLSNFNEMTVSNFETGSLFNFVSEKMGTTDFNSFLKEYLQKNGDAPVDTKDFLDQLAIRSHYSSVFLENLIARKHRVNFNLKKFKREDGNLLVKVKKNTHDPVPFKLETISKTGATKTHWFGTPEHPSEDFYVIPEADADKIVINSGHFFPEKNFRDNYIYTRGIFSNMKKIKLKLIKDIPNPEYNEIYLNPRVTFNAYDKILLGLNFRNESLFNHRFAYSLTPYYSTGTGQLTGSGAVTYSIMPPESFFRSLNLGVSGSYFHYDYDLSYRKFSASVSMNFAKNPRSAVSRSVGASFNHYEKELTPEMVLSNEYDRYNLWNLNYGFSDNRLIHEKSFGAYVQGMQDFQKVAAEATYRYEYAANKKIAFRLFAGYFLNNKTRNDIFDFGISKVSNYSFSYGLLGQSATSGVLAQQFVLADGGFKSFIDSTANQWITSFNIDSHVWKMFNVYADAGVYKNRTVNPKFIYDTGVKVRIVPDFLEVYLPVYSTLGFEPSFKDYAQRIRFTLVLNLSAVVNTLRRGWY